MRILLTNDDGLCAPGLAALYCAVQDLGDIAVVAPEQQQTAASHAITVLAPLPARRVRFNDAFDAWAVAGRPADCVRLALNELLDARPDFVISGINAGLNTGVYMLYSGTVAGAAEAAVFFGIPAMAVSLQLSDRLDFDRAARIARRIFERFAAAGPPSGFCLNVNIPALDAGPLKGVRVCPQDLTIGPAAYRRETDAHGHDTFILVPGNPERTGRADTDTQAVLDRYVAVTPLNFDLTDHQLLDVLTAWSWPQTLD
jgi:5'-nucleotidase